MDDLERLKSDWNRFKIDFDALQLWTRERAAEVSAVDVEACGLAQKDLRPLEERLAQVCAEVEDKLPDLDAFNDFYCEMARDCRLDDSDEIKRWFIRANHDWEELTARAAALLRRLRHTRNLFDNYEALRERELAWLKGFDARLTELELDAANSSREDGVLRPLRSSLAALRAEFAGREATARAGEAATHLVQRSGMQDAERVEEMAQVLF